jgi:hypothetical protein
MCLFLSNENTNIDVHGNKNFRNLYYEQHSLGINILIDIQNCNSSKWLISVARQWGKSELSRLIVQFCLIFMPIFSIRVFKMYNIIMTSYDATVTEKIFKPIVAKQPFVLLGCAKNLAYLQSYGFKTFGSYWDESYDNITDPLQRLDAVVSIVKRICALSDKELENLLHDMSDILEYNHRWFYSKEFIDFCWNELKNNLNQAISQLPHQIFLENQPQNNPDIRWQNTQHKSLTDILV